MKQYEINHSNNTGHYTERIEAENIEEAREAAKRIAKRWNTKVESVKKWED